MEKVKNDSSGTFFIDGPRGTGKTFLYKALLTAVRGQHFIALATASSGVAASLLPGGRTAHSRFKIPLETIDEVNCSVSNQSASGIMLQMCRLIIWDEAPMVNRCTIEAVDRMLRDITDSNLPFGGKVIVFGGDFRQVLPVVPRGKKDDVMKASLVFSDLWPSYLRLPLVENMRAKSDPMFCTYLLRIGNGTEEEHTYFTRTNSWYFSTYYSFDEAIDKSEQSLHEDFLNTLTPNGISPHELKLKVNCPVMLLRNINPSEGLCNGTRLTCRKFEKNVILAEITTESPFLTLNKTLAYFLKTLALVLKLSDFATQRLKERSI
ncbi:ATP-dependent DNA helicase PIF1-like [Olea europaea var. sylvestris]|uniref:ATP-dependent DNA helicase PIF1-like n=1 Tax=Olea europaea var. sylvestris TaxID=158386 RepID=UPI000C1D48B1|nr:ATP-dependent DNA helicase PIF1-like [Olea europaea var. sylvestris]